MYPFIAYKDGRLFMEDVDITALARDVPTPFYAYSSAAMRGAYDNLVKAINHPGVKIHYAVKTNSNVAVIKVLSQCGAGMEIVSGGELKRCLAAGVQAKDIVYAGVGKTEEEIELCLTAGLGQFHVESLPEAEKIAEVATRLKKKAPVALRINPEVTAGGHAKITTASKEAKFGINWDHVESVYARIASMPALEPVGITTHIGSQITDMAPFINAAERMEEMVQRLRKAGHAIPRVSLGGGLGISYHGENVPLTEYGKLVHDFAEHIGCDVKLEPGRYLAGEAGILVTRVLYVKRGTAKNFLIVDAGMNDLIRPTLYEAYHPIQPVVEPKDGKTALYDVVGPVCETGDYFALDRQLPVSQANELIVILCAGAHGAVMASTYNSRDLCGEVLISGKKSAVIRPRLTIEQQLSWETVPDWL